MIARWLLETNLIALLFSLAAIFFGGGLAYLLVRRNTMRQSAVIAPLLLAPLMLLLIKRGAINVDVGLLMLYAVTVLPVCAFQFGVRLAGIPREVIDAARVDGCSTPQLLRHIIVPLTAGASGTSLLIGFAAWWAEYIFAALLLDRLNVFFIKIDAPVAAVAPAPQTIVVLLACIAAARALFVFRPAAD